MIELIDPLLVSAVNFDEFSKSDLAAEMERMMLCNRYIHRFYEGILQGTLEPGFIDELGDVLAESEIEPYMWSENYQTQVKDLITSGNYYLIE